MCRDTGATSQDRRSDMQTNGLRTITNFALRQSVMTYANYVTFLPVYFL